MDQIGTYALRRLKQSARAEADARRSDPAATKQLARWLAEGWHILGATIEGDGSCLPK